MVVPVTFNGTSLPVASGGTSEVSDLTSGTSEEQPQEMLLSVSSYAYSYAYSPKFTIY